eukprot:TRINITY_DN27230_c0_g1_i3.p1 TRINITY_DN27230_c0_g1~~TRINITY_DN27230_c0_g1_i3.p1  ORF type:complete len:401 (-),score=46.17 TRINITY_DN27230_c0_g1_i3:3-1205(-)
MKWGDGDAPCSTFFAFGPCFWFLSAALPLAWLPATVSLAVSLLPTLLSLQVLRQSFLKQKTDDSAEYSAKAESVAHVRCERWLSFWICWPMLVVLNAACVRLPRLLAGSPQAVALITWDSQRALVLFAIWLQLWKGSSLFGSTIRWLLTKASCDVLMSPLRAATRFCSSWLGRTVGLQRAVQLVSGAIELANSHRSLWKFILSAVVAVIMVVSWTFYRAIHLMCSVLTLLTLVLAVGDTANIVYEGSKTFYVKRLSFWVLLQLWHVASKAPLVGTLLSLVTPAALGLFFLAGDRMLEWVVLPAIAQAPTLPRAFFQLLVGSAHGQKDGVGKYGRPTFPSCEDLLSCQVPVGDDKKWKGASPRFFETWLSPFLSASGLSMHPLSAVKLTRSVAAAASLTEV